MTGDGTYSAIAERDRKARQEMLAKLEHKITSHGIKSLVGNRGYRRYLKVNGDAVAIDREAPEKRSPV